MSRLSVNHLVRRDTTYYFRARVPKQYLAKFLGVTEVKFSLRTTNLNCAKRLSRYLSNAFEHLLVRKEHMAFLTVAEVNDFIRIYFQHSLNKAFELSYDIPSDTRIDIDDEVASLRGNEAEIRKRLVSRKYDAGDINDANEMLEAFKPPKASIDQDSLLIAYDGVVRAKLAQVRYLIASLTGDTEGLNVGDPLFLGMKPSGFNEIYSQPWDIKDVQQIKAITISQAVKDFLAAQSKSKVVEKTLADYERTLAWAIEIVGGDKTLESLTNSDVKLFRNALERIPVNLIKLKQFNGMPLSKIVSLDHGMQTISSSTQRKYLNLYNAFLNWCLREELISKKLGTSIKVIVEDAKTGDVGICPYDKDQLEEIFTSPIFAGRASISRKSTYGKLIIKDAFYWIPVIALLTGMRLGEIVQLLVSDVREKNGVEYFDVNTLGDNDKRLKTKESRRQIPIPDLLQDLGFQSFVSECGKMKSKRLFPEIECGKDGYYSSNFSKFWTRYSKAIGFYRENTRFHSFRHCFKDAIAAAECSEAVNRAIMGHSDESVHGSYGSGPTLLQLKTAINKAMFEIDIRDILGTKK